MKNRIVSIIFAICGVIGIIIGELTEVRFFKLLVPALVYMLLVINRNTKWWHIMFEGIILICFVLLALSKSYILSEKVFLISMVTLVLYAFTFLIVKIKSRKSENDLD